MSRLPEADDVLAVARIYGRLTGYSISTLSTRIFNDGKTLSRIAAGSDLTLSRFGDALRWFSDRWPADAEWPAEILRPEVNTAHKNREVQ